MPSRTHVRPSNVRYHKETDSDRNDRWMGKGEKSKSTSDIRTEIDEVLDAIDEVLVENAQEFIDGFIQKGGE